jgi:hypothetical protein
MGSPPDMQPLPLHQPFAFNTHINTTANPAPAHVQPRSSLSQRPRIDDENTPTEL